MIKFLDLQKNYLNIKDEIKNAINNVLDKNNYILGDELNTFENNFAKYITTKYCVGVGNGTDALEIALQSLYLQKNDIVLTQGNTFISTVFGVINNKYNIDLVDIDEKTYMIDLDLLENKFKNNKNIKCLIIVHLYGYCCDMDKLLNLCKKYNIILIEDCAQAHGALFNNKKLGSFGDISCFSFYPGKNLGAYGDGGAICTSNDKYYNLIKKIRNLGSEEKYNHEIIGRNSRLDTIQAAILDVKLKYLDNNNKLRRENFLLYKKYLKNIKLPEINELCVPVFHLMIIQFNTIEEKNNCIEKLKNNNIQYGIHYPISLSKSKCLEKYNFYTPVSDKISNLILSLPMYPELDENDIIKICNVINN